MLTNNDYFRRQKQVRFKGRPLFCPADRKICECSSLASAGFFVSYYFAEQIDFALTQEKYSIRSLVEYSSHSSFPRWHGCFELWKMPISFCGRFLYLHNRKILTRRTAVPQWNQNFIFFLGVISPSQSANASTAVIPTMKSTVYTVSVPLPPASPRHAYKVRVVVPIKWFIRTTGSPCLSI